MQKNQKKQNTDKKLIVKPFADDLNGYPKLQRDLEKISGKAHPIDTHCWLNKFLVGYAKNYMDLARRMVVTQNCHHRLPKEEEVLKVRDRLGRQLYEQRRQSDSKSSTEAKIGEFYDKIGSSEDISFSMSPHLRKRTLTAYMAANRWEITAMMLTLALVGALNFGAVFATKEGLDLVSEQISEHSELVDKEPILFYFGVVWVFGILSCILMNWVYILMKLLALRFFSGYTALIYEKLLRVGMTNPFEHGEGSIINHIQNDLMLLDAELWEIGQVFRYSCNLPLAFILGIYLFGVSFVVIMAGIAILCYLSSLILKTAVVNYNRWAQKTDSRLQLLKNVLKNINFIKIGALENTFFMKMVQKRKEEMVQRVYFLSYLGFLELAVAMGIAIIY